MKTIRASINGKEITPPNGFELVAVAPYSSHPGDEYLVKVLCQRSLEGETKYVTWFHNLNDGGFYSGSYFEAGPESAALAFKNFVARL